MTNRSPLYLLTTIAVLLSSLASFTSCNKDKDNDDSYSYSSSTQTTLVTGFALQADAKVLSNLDSVHFTVDFDRGLIYNADSLPKGTDISALKVTVDFLNTVSSAVFKITDATKQADTTINYTTSMTKSLDFTGKTLLTVTSSDKSQVKDYEVKVLVHKVNPDSLVIPQSWRRDLPGYQSGLKGYKAVKMGDQYCIMAYDGTTCELMIADSPNQGTWTSQLVDLPFVPQVESLVATTESLYMLDDDGVLYASENGTEWTSCGVVWHSLLGAYEDRVLGVLGDDDGYYHDEYPRPADFTATEVEEGFPIAHASDMVIADNKWTIAPQALIVGGVDSEDNVLRDVWGYDGRRWGKINSIHSTLLPELADATLFAYYSYKQVAGTRRYGLQPTYYLMGGRLSDGSLNSSIYLSTTQGVTWTVGDSTICQPTHMPKFYGAQAFVTHETLTAAVAPGAPRNIKSPVATWDCPFFYIFGGYNDQDELLPNVWRGVYIRMTNYPVY